MPKKKGLSDAEFQEMLREERAAIKRDGEEWLAQAIAATDEMLASVKEEEEE